MSKKLNYYCLLINRQTPRLRLLVNIKGNACLAKQKLAHYVSLTTKMHVSVQLQF